MRALRHVEAQYRADLIAVSSYGARLGLTSDGETFVSTTTIRCAAADADGALNSRQRQVG